MMQRILFFVIGASVSGTLIKLLLNATWLLSPRMFTQRSLLYAHIIPMLFFAGLGLAMPLSVRISIGTARTTGTLAGHFVFAYKTIADAVKVFAFSPALLVI